MTTFMVTGSFLSASLQVLFDRMASKNVVDFIRGKKLNQGLLKELKMMLKSASKVLNDAEWKQITDKDVRQWLQELKDAIYDAEDLIYEIQAEDLGSKMEGDRSGSQLNLFSQVSNFFSSRFTVEEIEEKMEDILSMLRFILERKDDLGLIEGVKTGPFPRLSEATMVNESDIYGRDADKEAIIKLLLWFDHEVGDSKICVVPIVGMGGIGKTTLAQLVYKHIDKVVDKPFDVKAWITVSNERDVFTLPKMIYERVTETQNCPIKETILLQYKLVQLLKGKKFLFVLDDVWEVNYQIWCKLKTPFESAENGSAIIVTTRQANIASDIGTVQKHDLQLMSKVDSWRLFSKHAFSGSSKTCAHRNQLEAIGQKIVKKCKGLPLAIKSLGCLLHSELDPKIWEEMVENDVWDQEENDILPALWLSYYHLPHHLKRCFAYCSIFPKDYKIEKERLILLWMAEDLLQPQKGKTLEEIGEGYFKNLASRSLFHVEQNSEHFTMHDLVNDLAKFVSGETCLRLDDNHLSDGISKARYFFGLTYTQGGDMKKLEYLFHNEKLRALLGLDLNYEVFNSHLNLQTMKYLRALNAWGQLFKYGPHREILYSIGSLKLLRYLDLSFLQVKELPNTICTSYNLQTLLLRNCFGLQGFPDSMGNLIHLRHLDLSITDVEMLPDTMCNLHELHTLNLYWCRKLTSLPTNFAMLSNLRRLQIDRTSVSKMPLKLSNLKNLGRLDKFVVGENRGSKIDELGKLGDLRGDLRITRLENVANVEEAILKNKMNIVALGLEWGRDVEDSETACTVLDKLHPHTNVKRLHIENYGGTMFPSWLGNASFHCIKSMCLRNCKNCGLLPPLGQLPSLEDLEISGFDMVERIGDEFYTDGRSKTVNKAFESLIVLNFIEMKNWREWTLMGGSGSGGGGGGGEAFSNLEELRFRNCGKLRCIPEYLPSLKRLEIQASEELLGSLSRCEYPSLEKLVMEEDQDRPTMNIKTIPQGRLPSSTRHIDVSGFQELESLSEEGWPSNLKSLSINYCGKLFAAQPMGWNLRMLTSLTSLSISRIHEELDSFPEEWQLPTTLTSLELWYMSKITSLNGKAFRHLTSLQTLEISYCQQIQCLLEEEDQQGLLPTSLTYLRLSYLPSLKSLNTNTFRCLTSLRTLNIQHCYQLQGFPQHTLPPSLSRLEIQGCPLLRDLNFSII